MTEYQLRIYHIKPGTMAEFVEGWRKHIIPVREKYGFKVLYAFSNTEASEFVWLVSHDSPDGYAAADAVYYQSPERNNLSWDPKQYIENIELRILQSIPVHLEQ
jgi:NIPSNAP